MPQIALAGILVIVSLQTCLCQGQNLAQNPGFEAGTTSGWFGLAANISAQSAVVHAGNYAGLVQGRTATWNGIAQSILGLIEPGRPYDVSIWVRLVSGTNQTAQLTRKQVDGSGTTYSMLGGGIVSSTAWTRLSGQLTVTFAGTPTDLFLYVELPTSATAEFYVDDVTITTVNDGTEGIDGQTVIDWNDLHQRIDGFGASSAWRSQWTSTQADMFFGTNSGTGVARNGGTFPFSGVGLSLLRTRIAPGATTVEQTIMQMAQARGARVWSAPWSPQTSFKTANANGVLSVNGGGFAGTSANYDAYAKQLAGYVAQMKRTYGIDLYAISVQNEPDFNTTNYESCAWTGQQIHDFIPYLSAALIASNVGTTRIIIPESENWKASSLYTTAMEDPAVAPLVSVIANHNYVADNNVGDQTTPAALPSYGKPLWETEVSKLSGNDSSIEDGLYWARRIHLFLTQAEASAWHYWWLIAYGSGNQGLCDTNEVPAKRMYALGNFSRFVRPGFFRIGSSSSGSALVSSYRNTTNGNFAVVAVNASTSAVTQTFYFTNFTSDAVTPWVTSAGLSLAPQALLNVTNGVFACVLPPKSIVTLTGQASPSNSPPTLAFVPDLAVNAGANVYVTNSATDPDAGQTLTFTLLTGPTNTTLDAASGLLFWRPLVSEANTTNPIAIKVADNGTPSLSATNHYAIVVNELPAPTLGLITVEPGGVRLAIDGAIGPDYTLLSSTNLTDWQPLLTTNLVSSPTTLIDIVEVNGIRFYRLMLGP